jgi:uncharacterized oxidoreductase
MKYFSLDVADPRSIRSLAEKTERDFPALNCLINNAGVQSRSFNFGGPGASFDDAAMANEIQTNVIGLIRMCAAFIPLLKRNDDATLMNVSSGLAFVPIAWMPVYCATKAAVHSFTLSLRRQLRDAGIRVIELVPPWVKTELGGPQKEAPSAAVQPMPLNEFIAATMQQLAGDADEIMIGGAAGLANAGGLESAKGLFARMNG